MVLPIIAAAGQAAAGAARAGLSAAGKAAASAARSGAAAARSGAKAASSGVRSAGQAGSRRAASAEPRLGALSERRIASPGAGPAEKMESSINADRVSRSLRDRITYDVDESEQSEEESEATTEENDEIDSAGDELSTEISLNNQKSQAQNKPGGSGQLEEMAKTLVKQQVKKSLMIYSLPILGAVLYWLVIILLIIALIFAFASVYMCAQKKGVLKTLWTTSFGTDFMPLLEESFSGSCLAETTPAPKTTDAPAKQTEQSSVPQETTK